MNRRRPAAAAAASGGGPRLASRPTAFNVSASLLNDGFSLHDRGLTPASGASRIRQVTRGPDMREAHCGSAGWDEAVRGSEAGSHGGWLAHERARARGAPAKRKDVPHDVGRPPLERHKGGADGRATVGGHCCGVHESERRLQRAAPARRDHGTPERTEECGPRVEHGHAGEEGERLKGGQRQAQPQDHLQPARRRETWRGSQQANRRRRGVGG